MPAAAILLAVVLGASAPATTNNDDSCDIAVTPAATLRLPYFEVDLNAAQGTGANTLFTITNTSAFPQIAHVTVWSDWTYPVLAFNVLLTGYDVQGVNLYDVLVRGELPGGQLNAGNPNFVADGPLAAGTRCAGQARQLPALALVAARNALSTGAGAHSAEANCILPVGGSHPGRASGYLTIDVVATCTSQFATDPSGTYFAGGTAPLLFDNVLLGDFQQLNTPNGADAQGSPMVHIRAVPEGGLPGAGGAGPVPTNLPFTFYDRYTPDGARTADRRQPLPSTFIARFLEGGSAPFTTNVKIWREGVTRGLPDCAANGDVKDNSSIMYTSVVRFDEHENSWVINNSLCTLGCYSSPYPAVMRAPSTSYLFPALQSYDVGGWLFLNLSSGTTSQLSYSDIRCRKTLSAQRPGFGSACADQPPGTSGSRAVTQNWVTMSMSGPLGANRLGVELDAAWITNGCTGR